jgi:hypothetical protein
MLHKQDTLIRQLNVITKIDWLVVIDVMKWQCISIVPGFIDELKCKFLGQYIMNVTSAIYSYIGCNLMLNKDLRHIWRFWKFALILGRKLDWTKSSS